MSSEILIIDDNVDIRNILNDLIKDAGYKTRVAANYNQALKEIDKNLNNKEIKNFYKVINRISEVAKQYEFFKKGQVILTTKKTGNKFYTLASPRLFISSIT